MCAELYQMSASMGKICCSKVDLIKLLKSEPYFPTGVLNEIGIIFPRKCPSRSDCTLIFLFEELQELAASSRQGLCQLKESGVLILA